MKKNMCAYCRYSEPISSTALSGWWGEAVNEALKRTKSLYYGHSFPAVVISCAVRWYFRFSLSLRDIDESLLDRGVVATYETVRC